MLIVGNAQNSDLTGTTMSLNDVGIFGKLLGTGNSNNSCPGITYDTYFNVTVSNLKECIRHDSHGTTPTSWWYDSFYDITISGYKIKLKPCMDITGGTGSCATPYELTANCNAT